MGSQDMSSLRRVLADDSEFLFSWANDSDVIKGSFLRSSLVTREQHTKWFDRQLNDSSAFLYIVLDQNDIRVGQVRFDIVRESPTESFISIGIAPQFRRRGFAARAIELGTEKIFLETNIRIVHAYIRPSNVGSQKAFIQAGYTDKGASTYMGVDAVYMAKKHPASS